MPVNHFYKIDTCQGVDLWIRYNTEHLGLQFLKATLLLSVQAVKKSHEHVYLLLLISFLYCVVLGPDR